MAKVAAIITTYNGATRGFLTEAIESVLDQTFTDFELLIVDDGSTDETEHLCARYLADGRVRYIRRLNGGPGAARNTGIRRSSAPYICFLDDDDVWKPEKLEKMVEFVASHPDPDIGMAYHAVEIIDDRGTCSGLRYATANGDIYRTLLMRNIVQGPSTAIIREDVFDDVGGFREELRNTQDWEMWIRIASRFRVYSLEEPLSAYRMHEQGQIQGNQEKVRIYQLLTLYYASAGDSDSRKAEVYREHYRRQAVVAFGAGDYEYFRRCCHFAKGYGGSEMTLRIKYLLSFFPPLARWADALAHRVKRSGQ